MKWQKWKWVGVDRGGPNNTPNNPYGPLQATYY